MKIFLLYISLLLWVASAGAVAFTDFYVTTSTTNNLNSGHTPDATPTYAATAGDFTNNTSATTCTWFKSGENLSGVTNGAWASIFTDGATTNVFVGRVTAVDDTADTITINLQASSAAPPATTIAGTSIRVGGAWRGPRLLSAAVNTNDMQFPFNYMTNSMTNAVGNVPFVNFKGTFSVTNPIGQIGQSIWWGGYTNTLRDGGKATIDGGSITAGYILFASASPLNNYQDFTFSNNGMNGSTVLVNITGAKTVFFRSSFHDARNMGLVLANTYCAAVECEAYNCNKANGALAGGISLTGNGILARRCVSFNNGGTASAGFNVSDGTSLQHCIAYSNGNSGFRLSSSGAIMMTHCDSYNNLAAGADLTTASANSWVFIENCNFVHNTGAGIACSGSTARNGMIWNCGFGTGSETNSGGDITNTITSAVLGGIQTNGCFQYALNVKPWTDATNGNFTINLTAAKAAGRGNFLQTLVNSPTNTVSFPDMGAAQSASTNTTIVGGAGGSWTFAQ